MADTDHLFTEFLASHREGLTDHELAGNFRDLIAAVTRIRKGGKLTLTITASATGDMVVLTEQIKVDLPKEPTEPKSYFLHEGWPTRDNPTQLKLVRPDGAAPGNFVIGARTTDPIRAAAEWLAGDDSDG